MEANYYTFRLQDEDYFRNSFYKKRAPSIAVKSIFKRLLREIDDKFYETKIVIKNIKTGKLYYYLCKAMYNPTLKIISEYRQPINQRYEINVIKLNAQSF